MHNIKVSFNWMLYLSAFVAVFMLGIFASSKFNDEWNEQIKAHYRIYSAPIPEEIQFAGEKILLNEEDIIERFDRELLTNMYWQSQTLLFIKRANKYFPIIEPILKANNIPDDFKYLCLAESGLQPLVVSPAGAASYWQFLDKTAKNFGLTVNDEVDERYHLQKSTEAACKYFNLAYRTFGSWGLVAASYNMGIEGVRRQLLAQGETNYEYLFLNQETSRYLLRIIAIKQIVSKPQDYGFHVADSHKYKRMPTIVVAVNENGIDLYEFAKNYGCTYKDLKYYNPWLRKSTLNAKEVYYIHLPKRKLETLLPLVSDTIFHNALPDDMLEVIHIINAGETLQSIANLYNVPVDELVKLNNLKSQTLQVGSKIRVRKVKLE
jgi:membrane-bound lytic murein transglycosylase D